MTTPGYIRGEAVTAIINAVHGGCHDTWHLIAATQLDVQATVLTFAVGYVQPDQPDGRPTVDVTIVERLPFGGQATPDPSTGAAPAAYQPPGA